MKLLNSGSSTGTTRYDDDDDNVWSPSKESGFVTQNKYEMDDPEVQIPYWSLNFKEDLQI